MVASGRLAPCSLGGRPFFRLTQSTGVEIGVGRNSHTVHGGWNFTLTKRVLNMGLGA